MSWLDNVIRTFSPEAAARRARGRRMEAAEQRALDAIQAVRKYDGAGGGRLSSNWYAPASDPNELVKRYSRPLRDRSRDSVRNSPICANVVTVHADYIVGSGIRPRAKTNDKDYDAYLNQLFDDWTKTSHPEETMNWYGQQYLACREMVEGGEIFARARTRRISDGYEVPLQIQLLEAEHCDGARLEISGGKRLINGIEFDKIGRRKGYWMFEFHPQSRGLFASSNVSKLVPADQIAHLFEPQRTQVRGVTWLAPILQYVRQLEDYELAENVRKKIEACMVGIIIPKDNDDIAVGYREDGQQNGDNDHGGVQMTDTHGNPFERFEPGMFGVAHGGGDVKFNNPAMTQGMEAYVRTRLRAIASGSRVPYELLTGDYSQANFASGRLGLLNYRRFVSAFQRHYFIPQFCAPTMRWFVQRARWAGKISEKPIRWEWHTPGLESISPVDESKADLMDIRMGKRSPQDVISQTGRDPERVLEEIGEWKEKTEGLDLVLDSNPWQTTLNGQMQNSGNAAAPVEQVV